MSKLPKSYVSSDIASCYILLVPIYSFFFLIGYKPFNINISLDVEMGRFAFYASILISIQLVVTLISRFAMKFVYRYKSMRYLTYYVWVFFEIIVVAMFCNLFIWLIQGRETPYVTLLPTACMASFFINIFPYAILTLMAEISNRNEIIEQQREEINNYSNGIIGANRTTPIHFLDDKKATKLVVTLENILYIEAADNYVVIHYVNMGKSTKFSLRNTMRGIEEICTSNAMVRCHRSYFINLRRVRVLQKDKEEGLFAELDIASAPHIPISKTYADSVVKAFSKLND